jgi:hypothetical protein
VLAFITTVQVGPVVEVHPVQEEKVFAAEVAGAVRVMLVPVL